MKILLICGMSGVGKSSIAMELCKDEEYNLIKSYTDRPMRNAEDDHIFLDKQHMDELIKEDLAAFSEIDGNRYCARIHQFVEDKINVYIVDMDGMNDIIKSFPKADILSVLITRKKVYIDEDRKNRDIKIPSRDDVCVKIENNTTLESCINTIKALVSFNGGIFFKIHHSLVMSLQEKIDYHKDMVDYHIQCIKEYKEELECMNYEE